MFLQCFPVSHTGNIVSRVSFCFQDANYAYGTRQGILTKIRACEHLQKLCEHEQASTNLIFASTFKLKGNIRYPCCTERCGNNITEKIRKAIDKKYAKSQGLYVSFNIWKKIFDCTISPFSAKTTQDSFDIRCELDKKKLNR